VVPARQGFRSFLVGVHRSRQRGAPTGFLPGHQEAVKLRRSDGLMKAAVVLLQQLWSKQRKIAFLRRFLCYHAAALYQQ
jgi:hypothetical protein